MHPGKNYLWIFILCFAFFLGLPAYASNSYNANTATAVSTQSIPQTSKQDWHYEVAPYLWLANLSTDVTVHGVSEHVYISFGDILKNLDFAMQGHLEVGYGRWSFMLDPTFMKLSKDFTVHAIPIDTTFWAALIDSGVFFQIFASPITTNGSTSSFELLGGARYMGTKYELDVDSLSLSQREDSISPIIGGRFKFYFNPKTMLWVRGDVGGFNVDGMKQTWSVITGLAYAVHKNFDLGIAYRVLKLDYVNNSDQFVLNTLMYGPMIGFAVHN